MSLKSNSSSLNDLSLDNFMTLAHSVSIEGLDTNFSLHGNEETEEKKVNELRDAIEVLKKSLLEFEIELVFLNEMNMDELNLKIQKYYYNKILYESLEKEYREKKKSASIIKSIK
jgi:hypothetical protein